MVTGKTLCDFVVPASERSMVINKLMMHPEPFFWREWKQSTHVLIWVFFRVTVIYMDRYILFQSHICSENLTWLRDRIDSIFFTHLGCLFIYIITHWTYINICCICHLITIEVERTSTCGQCVHQATAFTSYSCATTGRGGSKLPCCQPLRRSTLFKEFCNPGGMPPSMEWYQSCSAKFEIEIGNSPWNCTHKSFQRPI